MIIDAQLQFSDAQAVTATAVSTNVAQLGPYFNNQLVDIGVGEDLYIYVGLETAMTDSGSDSTVTVTLETDTDSAFGSPTTVQTVGVFPALSPAGSKLIAKLQPLQILEQFIRVKYTVAGGDLTTGSFNAQIVKDVDAYRSYSDAFTIS